MNCHSEIEARKKICPLRQAACVGAECMAWRWVFDRATTLEFDRKKYEADGFRAIAVSGSDLGPRLTMVRQSDRGYCGLAGSHLEALK